MAGNTPAKRRSPTKLTPQIVEVLAQAMRRGLGPELQAASAGVSSNAVRLWIERGRRGDGGVYGELVRQLDAARAARVDQLQSLILLHATPSRELRDADGLVLSAARKGEWRAASYLLERIDPSGGGRGVLRELDELEGGRERPPDVIDAEPVLLSADASDVEVQEERVRRYRRQIALAEAAGDLGAVASLTRRVERAEDTLRELRRAAAPAGSAEVVPAGDPAELVEEEFRRQLQGAAEGMPEAHLRIVVDVWLARHRLQLVREGLGYRLAPDGSVRLPGGGGN